MPTSTPAEGEGAAVARNGFTLVELMIAIAVMALLAGVVVVSAGVSASGPEDRATRFASRLAAARDEAILTRRPMSAWVSPSGYGFDQLRDGRWERLTHKPFRGEDWGPGMNVALSGASAGRARVRFDSIGMADQPLRIQLSRDGRAARVQVAPNGEVRVD